jgi:DNA-binding NarL/FixJ family response regulator
VSACLALDGDLTLVGGARDVASAASQAATLRPDIVLVDAEIPFLDLPTLLEALGERSSSSKVLVLKQDVSALSWALEGGSVILISKHEGPAALPPAIHAAIAD